MYTSLRYHKINSRFLQKKIILTTLTIVMKTLIKPRGPQVFITIPTVHLYTPFNTFVYPSHCYISLLIHVLILGSSKLEKTMTID